MIAHELVAFLRFTQIRPVGLVFLLVWLFTGRRKTLLQRAPQFPNQEILFDSRIQMIPRQRRIQRNVSHPHFGIDVEIIKHLAPRVQFQLVGPGVEATPAFVSQFHGFAQPSVAA